jgi:hypothetical protein
MGGGQGCSQAWGGDYVKDKAAAREDDAEAESALLAEAIALTAAAASKRGSTT